MKEHATNFLLYSYFGIEEKDLTDANKGGIAKKCAERAYFDLNRTLNFREKVSSSTDKSRTEKEHRKFREHMSEEVKKHIENLFEAGNNIDFNNWHQKACISIIDEAVNYSTEGHKVIKKKEFYYGQAQKWLNMTLKYMWLLGLWDNKFDEIEKHLHVPVDRYIIHAAKQKNISFLAETKSWSKWDNREYIDFQNSLEKLFHTKGSSEKSPLPLVWESNAWITAAKELG